MRRRSGLSVCLGGEKDKRKDVENLTTERFENWESRICIVGPVICSVNVS